MMQQRPTRQCSTADSNFKMLISKSMSAVLRQTVQLRLNVKSSPQSVCRNMSTVCSRCCQDQ